MNIQVTNKQYIVNGFQGHYSNFNFGFIGSKVRVLYEMKPITDLIEVTSITVNSVDVADAADFMEKVSIIEPTPAPALPAVVNITSSPYTITAADNGRLLVVKTSTNIYFSLASGLPVGFSVKIFLHSGSFSFYPINPDYSYFKAGGFSVNEIGSLSIFSHVGGGILFFNKIIN